MASKTPSNDLRTGRILSGSCETEQPGKFPTHGDHCRDESVQAMRKTKPHTRLRRFASDISTHTPFIRMILLLLILWLMFSAGFFLAERGADGATITSYGDALYWGIAAFSTAGTADTPQSSFSQLIGSIWIVLGSVLFFGTIVRRSPPTSCVRCNAPQGKSSTRSNTTSSNLMIFPLKNSTCSRKRLTHLSFTSST